MQILSWERFVTEGHWERLSQMSQMRIRSSFSIVKILCTLWHLVYCWGGPIFLSWGKHWIPSIIWVQFVMFCKKKERSIIWCIFITYKKFTETAQMSSFTDFPLIFWITLWNGPKLCKPKGVLVSFFISVAYPLFCHVKDPVLSFPKM